MHGTAVQNSGRIHPGILQVRPKPDASLWRSPFRRLAAAATAGPLRAAADGAVAGHAGRHRRPEAPAGGHSCARRPPLPGCGMARPSVVQPAEGKLPAQRAPARRHGRGGRPGCQTEAQTALLYAPVHRLDEPGQFRGDQPRGHQAGPRNQRRERQGRARSSARRSEAGTHLDHRRERLRGRQERRSVCRLGGVRERVDPVDPVRAADRTGRATAAADRAAVHQQVLHPRLAARQLLRALRLRTRPYGVSGVVAQPRRGAGRDHLGRLPATRRDARDRNRARHQRRRSDQRARLVRGRHDPVVGACGAAGARRTAGGQPDAADHDARLSRSRRPGRVHRRAQRSAARAEHRPRRHLLRR